MDPEEFDPASVTPADSPRTLEDLLASPDDVELMTTTVVAGDPAPGFDLPRLDDPHRRVRLRDLVGHQPVALVFGSYT